MNLKFPLEVHISSSIRNGKTEFYLYLQLSALLKYRKQHYTDWINFHRVEMVRCKRSCNLAEHTLKMDHLTG